MEKWLIFSGLGLIFALSMWFIFKPSERTQALEQSGLNDVVPQASVEQLENKLKAYSTGTYERVWQSNVRRWAGSDYFGGEALVRGEEAQSSSKIEGRSSSMRVIVSCSLPSMRRKTTMRRLITSVGR